MESFKQRLTNTIATVMSGRKCDCVGCNCHYSRRDAETVADAVGMLVTAEVAGQSVVRTADTLWRRASAVAVKVLHPSVRK